MYFEHKTEKKYYNIMYNVIYIYNGGIEERTQ